jgi:hypothetical protein
MTGPSKSPGSLAKVRAIPTGDSATQHSGSHSLFHYLLVSEREREKWPLAKAERRIGRNLDEQAFLFALLRPAQEMAQWPRALFLFLFVVIHNNKKQ